MNVNSFILFASLFEAPPSSLAPISLIAKFSSFLETNNGILVIEFSPSVMLSADFALFLSSLQFADLPLHPILPIVKHDLKLAKSVLVQERQCEDRHGLK